MQISTALATAKVHFIGIGGIGMCGLAELLHNMGAQVSGSDLSENQQTERLRELGVRVFKGHQATHLGEAEVVVYSSAVKSTNPEYQAARQRKIPLIPRAEALAEIMRLKRGVAVAGTHGKTTTTSLAASIFIQADLDPTVVVGGRLDLIKSTACLGQGEWLIAEADESDGSFNRLAPEVVIITNIDNDHLDHYGSFTGLQQAFFDFASRIPFYGLLVVCGDDSETLKLFSDFGKRMVTYGFSEQNDFYLVKDTSQPQGQGVKYQVYREGELLGGIQPSLPGQHNALNSLAALIVALEAGIQFEDAKRALASFAGVDRRFQKRHSRNGIESYDDYGHHPTEIKAVLNGFRERFPGHRLVVLFQPHRYSRTQICWPEFLTCFEVSDLVYITDIYPAGEAPVPGITSQELCEKVQHPHCHYLPLHGTDDITPLAKELRSGDILITLGAGDIWKWGDRIFK